MVAQKIYVGRRKNAVARVRLLDGSGAFMINGKKIDEFISRIDHKESVLNVLRLCNLEKKLAVYARVNGGGITGQKDALRLAMARGICEKFPEFKAVMKENGLLTRDPREKERRKYGLAKARKRYQFSKR